MKQHALTQHASVRAALVTAALATLVGVSSGSADQGNGQGNGHGNGKGNGPKHSAEATSVSPQPTPTAMSPQPTPTAMSAQPTPTAQATHTGGRTQDKEEDKAGNSGDNSLEHRHAVSGHVLEKGSGWLRIATASGLEVRVTISGQTELRGRGNEALELSDIEVGDRVNVQGDPTEEEGDATLEARRIRVHAEDAEDGGGVSADEAESERGGSGRGRGRGRGQGQGRGPGAED